MTDAKENAPELSSEQQVYKIVKDFVRDILITFPECKDLLTPGIIDVTLDKIETEEAKSVYKYCEQYYPEKFFDILYEKEEIITGEDSYFLPNIQFSKLWKEDISDRTRQTIWKYLQLILFSVVQNSDENFLGIIPRNCLKQSIRKNSKVNLKKPCTKCKIFLIFRTLI